MPGSLLFNGGSGIKIPNFYTSFSNFIIELKIISYTSYSSIRTIFANKHDKGYTDGYQIYIFDNKISIQYMWNSTSYILSSNDLNINDGKIHKLKCNFTISHVNIYLDNNIIISQDTQTNLKINNSFFEIGGLTWDNILDTRGFHHGVIGNVKIYNNNDLKNYYKINDGVGTTIKDCGPLQLNGVLVGSAYTWLTKDLFNNVYLIKQQDKYYSIKPEFYSEEFDSYLPTLINESELSIDNFDNYSINDLSLIHSNALLKLIDNKYNLSMLK